MARILLADSQPLFNEALKALFSRGGAHEVVGSSASAEETLSTVRRLRPDLVLIDGPIGLAGAPTLVARILQTHADAKVVVLGDDRDADLLLAAIRAGAAGVVGKTHRSGTVLRVAAAVLAGEAAVPRSMLLQLTGRMLAEQRPADSPLDRLSPREREVLALLSRGWDNARIGKGLFISQHTVRTHVQNILEKLGMHSKLEAATYAMQRSLELSANGPAQSTETTA